LNGCKPPGKIRPAAWFSLLLLIVAAGCRQARECAVPHPDLDYEVVRSIDVPVTGRQYINVSTSVILENDTAYYYGLDIPNSSIDIINLTSARYARTLQLNQSGPDEVVYPMAMFVQNTDSLFLMNDYNSFYLINGEGRKINQWRFTGKLPPGLTGSSLSGLDTYTILAVNSYELVRMPFVYLPREKTILAACLWLPSYRNTRAYFEHQKFPLITELSLPDNKFVAFIGRYPPLTGNKVALDMLYSFTSTGNDILVGVMYSPLVFSRNRNSYFCIASKYAHGKVERFSEGVELDDHTEMRIVNANEAYHGIYYDPYRNLLYRVFQLAQPQLDKDNKLLQRIQATWSVIVFTPDGKILGETLFEKEKYDFLNINILPEGVLISKENSFNQKNTEDMYSFDIVKFHISQHEN